MNEKLDGEQKKNKYWAIIRGVKFYEIPR